MPDEPISQLTALTNLEPDDLLVTVDIHDQTMATSGTDKKMTVAQLFGTPSTGQLVGWQGEPVGITLGTNLSLSGNTLNATGGGGGGGSGTVNSGTAGQIAYYASTGTAVSGETIATILGSPSNGQLLGWASGAPAGITLGTNLSITSGTLNASGGGTPGGSSGQVQYDNSGAFGGAANLTISSNSLANLTAVADPGTFDPNRTVTPSSGCTRITRAFLPSSLVSVASNGRCGAR